MDIVVCVKNVPETAENELTIDETRRRIRTEGLVFGINEWDNYALEEAISLKERFGGSVIVVTVGSEKTEEMLRMCLAKGADRAIRLDGEASINSDAYIVAKILHRGVKDIPFDLILTGAQSDDAGYAQVGTILAKLLGIIHTTMVKKIETNGEIAKVNRELEEGLEEIVEVRLPAVLTIQTGINEPRYASITGIMKARNKRLDIVSLEDLGLKEEGIEELESWIRIEELFMPPLEKKAVFLKGTSDEIVSKVVEYLKERRLI
ncbi:MAG: electron transfer flavoprotein subunit beta/FixA family protein [Candidatus Hodarchaeota archaeon]